MSPPANFQCSQRVAVALCCTFHSLYLIANGFFKQLGYRIVPAILVAFSVYRGLASGANKRTLGWPKVSEVIYQSIHLWPAYSTFIFPSGFLSVTVTLLRSVCLLQHQSYCLAGNDRQTAASLSKNFTGRGRKREQSDTCLKPKKDKFVSCQPWCMCTCIHMCVSVNWSSLSHA